MAYNLDPYYKGNWDISSLNPDMIKLLLESYTQTPTMFSQPLSPSTPGTWEGGSFEMPLGYIIPQLAGAPAQVSPWTALKEGYIDPNATRIAVDKFGGYLAGPSSAYTPEMKKLLKQKTGLLDQGQTQDPAVAKKLMELDSLLNEQRKPYVGAWDVLGGKQEGQLTPDQWKRLLNAFQQYQKSQGNHQALLSQLAQQMQG